MLSSILSTSLFDDREADENTNLQLEYFTTVITTLGLSNRHCGCKQCLKVSSEEKLFFEGYYGMLGRAALITAQRIHPISFGSLSDQIEDLHWLPIAAVQWKSPFDKLRYAVERHQTQKEHQTHDHYCEPLRPIHRDCNTFATPIDSGCAIVESFNPIIELNYYQTN